MIGYAMLLGWGFILQAFPISLRPAGLHFCTKSLPQQLNNGGKKKECCSSRFYLTKTLVLFQKGHTSPHQKLDRPLNGVADLVSVITLQDGAKHKICLKRPSHPSIIQLFWGHVREESLSDKPRPLTNFDRPFISSPISCH